MNKPFTLKFAFTLFFITLYQFNLKAQNTYVDTTKVIVVVVPWQNGGPVKTYSVPNADGKPGVTTYISSTTPVKNTLSGSFSTNLPNTEKTGSGKSTDTTSSIKNVTDAGKTTLKSPVVNSTGTTYPIPFVSQNKTIVEKTTSGDYTDAALALKKSDHPKDASSQNFGTNTANTINPTPLVSQNKTTVGKTGSANTDIIASRKTLANSQTNTLQNAGINSANITSPNPVVSPNKTTTANSSLLAQNTNTAKQNNQQIKRDTVYIHKRDTVFIKQTPASTISNRSLFLEVGGPGLAISLNYDKRFSDDKRNGWGFRIGTGYFGDGGNTVFTIPFQVNYLMGSGSNLFEVGAGTTFLNSTGDNTGKTFIFDRVTGFIGTATIGYRYQPQTSSLNFRIGFVPIFSDEGITPAGGISIGYTFKSL